MKQAVALADGIHQGSDGKAYPYLFEMDRPGAGTKDALLLYATGKAQGKWTGHARYVHDRDRAAQIQKEDQLMRWLIVHLLGEAPGKISERHALLEDAVSTSEVINTLLLRHLSGHGVLNPRKKKAIVLHKDEFLQIRKKYDADPAAWLAAAKKRQAALLAEIPAALHPGLGAPDWLQAHLKKGPPKVTAKTAMAENIPALTGIYFYELIG